MRLSMTASSMLSYIEALIKNFFFNFMFSFCSASFETSKSKFLAHLDEPLKNYPYFTEFFELTDRYSLLWYLNINLKLLNFRACERFSVNPHFIKHSFPIGIIRKTLANFVAFTLDKLIFQLFMTCECWSENPHSNNWRLQFSKKKKHITRVYI